MGRIIAVGPGGKAQAPARDDRFRPVIDLCREHRLLGRPLLSPPCPTMTAADDVRRGLYRSARYYCSCGDRNCTRKRNNIDGCPAGGQRIGARAEIVKDAAGKWRVQFRLFDKAEAMREVVRKYGPDPNAWPYYSRRKKPKEK